MVGFFYYLQLFHSVIKTIYFLGNFAVVWLCKEVATNKEYALKVIDKQKCKGKVGL